MKLTVYDDHHLDHHWKISPIFYLKTFFIRDISKVFICRFRGHKFDEDWHLYCGIKIKSLHCSRCWLGVMENADETMYFGVINSPEISGPRPDVGSSMRVVK